MSINNENNEPVQSGSEPLQNDDHPDSHDRTRVEDLPKTNAVLPDIKNNMQAKEVVINIGNTADKNAVVPKCDKALENTNNLVYGLYGQHMRPPKSTWVMFTDGGAPGGQAPLDYEPRGRNGFIRLTLTILLVMILVTAGFVIMVLTSENLSESFRTKGVILAFPAMIVMILLSYSIACSPCTRMFPCNIVILFVAVICMSIVCAWITSRYDTEIVIYALMATCIVVFICILLAFSGFDFTAWMLYIVVIAAAFFAITMVIYVGMLITGKHMKTVHLVILIIGTLINVVILTMELQMVLGGGAVELGEDEYALGAFLLYTSIVDIFLKLVQILGILDSM